jgi:hypothetical protein
VQCVKDDALDACRWGDKVPDRTAGAGWTIGKGQLGRRSAQLAPYIWTALAVVQVIVDLDFVAGGGVNVWFASGPIVGLAVLVVLAATVLCAIVVSIWLYRAMAVAHHIDPGLSISPAGAIGWYFVPIAGLWKPYEAMVEIVETSGARRPGKWAFVRDLIGWWWAAWIGRAILGTLQNFMPPNADPAIGVSVPQVVVLLFSEALGIAAALCLATIIRHTAHLQLRAVDPTIFD